MKTWKVTGKVIASERMRSSVNGNPRYLVTILGNDDSVMAYTKPDSSLGYCITNSQYRNHDHIYTLRVYRGKTSIEGIEGI